MPENDIRKALGLIAILKGMSMYLKNRSKVNDLIELGINYILDKHNTYNFELNSNKFKDYILEDFKIMLQYSEEASNTKDYFEGRKFLKEFNKEYVYFYNFLSQYIKKDSQIHSDISQKFSIMFKKFKEEHQ